MMLQRACPTARNIVVSSSRQCLHRSAPVDCTSHVRQPSRRCMHTQFGSSNRWWQQSSNACKHLGLTTLAIATGTGLAVQCMASDSQTITEKATGVNFPQVTKFWQGEAYRCMGAGVRTKKVAFVNVKIYAVALFVEAEPAAHELGIRHRGGFFQDNSDDDYNLALTDGAFNKLIQVHLVRKIEGEQFFGAIEEALTPRLSVTGEIGTLNKFKQFFDGKSLEKGSDILLLWKKEGVLEVVAKPHPSSGDYSQVQADLKIDSPGLCRALFEVYTGSNTVVPEAKKAWAEGARQLLDSEEIRRSTRRAGGGKDQ